MATASGMAGSGGVGGAAVGTTVAAMLAAAFGVLVPLALGIGPWVLLAALAAPLAWKLIETVQSHSDGPTLNRALGQTGLLQLVFCVLLAIGILAS